jgi:LruC domain-containing protein
MIPTDWQYPEERERITKAYATSTHEFKTWATSADHSEAKDWYSFPSGKVMTKN